MSENIINKVTDSGIITIDLTTLLPNSEIVLFDIKPYLFMELILKEKDFRASLQSIDWSTFQDKIVGIHCSADAIIPMWANMLIVSNLQPYVKGVYFGDETKVREQLILEKIIELNANDYTNQRVVVKGCGEIHVGESAYIAITQKLRTTAKSIMFGEPCSTVPVFKRKD
jgi:hypothetical protein